MQVQVGAEEPIPLKTVGPYQILILLIGILVLLSDGFDAQIVSFVAPALSKEWGVPKTALAEVFSGNIFGLMIGAFVIAPLADTLGRKIVTSVCVGVFGCLSLAMLGVHSPHEAAMIRFGSGLALGGAMPCMISGTAEFLPGRLRTRLVVLLATAWSAGIALCGLIVSAVIKTQGWRFMFGLDGTIALVSLAALVLLTPESPAFLLAKGKYDQLKTVLARIQPDLDFDPATAPAAATAAPKFPVAALFSGDLAQLTPLIWLTYFAKGASVYFFINWLTIAVNSAGYDPAQSSFAASMYQLGGLCGGFVIGYFTDRKGGAAIAVSMFLSALAIFLTGQTTASYDLMLVAVGVTGFLVVGNMNTLHAYVSGHIYPSQVRSTGLGWAVGATRLSGAIAGSLGVAVLLKLQLGPAMTFGVIAIAEVISGFAILAAHMVARKRPSAAGDPSAA